MIFTLYDYSCYYLYSLLLLFLVILNKTLAACIFYFILFYFFNLFPDFPRIPWNLLIPFVSPICMLCKSFIKKNKQKSKSNTKINNTAGTRMQINHGKNTFRVKTGPYTCCYFTRAKFLTA